MREQAGNEAEKGGGEGEDSHKGDSHAGEINQRNHIQEHSWTISETDSD